jgi:DNA-binding transcriptional LysR family regulator
LRDLNDLSFFAAVVAHGGFSAAARALNLPKSRISRRITALETQLGVRLIERSTRRFSVTEVGRDVYRHARAAIAEADSIEEVAHRMKGEPQGLVRISVPQGMEQTLAPGLPKLLVRYPRLRVQMIVLNRRVDLIDEGIDVAVRVRAALDTDQDLQVKIIGRTRRVLVASPVFLATHTAPSAPQEIPSLPTISHTERPGLDRWSLYDAEQHEEIVAHEPRLAASEHSTLMRATLDGMGVAFLPELFCRDALRDGTLARVLPEWSSREEISHIVFTSRRGLLPGVRAVIDFAAEALDPQWRPGKGERPQST